MIESRLFVLRRFSGIAALLVWLLLSPATGWSSDFDQLVKQAASGNSRAALQAGRMLVDGTIDQYTVGQTKKLLQPLVDDGVAEAELLLGRAYRDGVGGVSKNPSKGFHLIEVAAGRDGKSAEAQFELGKCYYLGLGTDKNLIAAYMWTTLSLDAAGASYQQSARQQQDSIAEKLNAKQLDVADELVRQIRTVYLQD